MEASAPPEAPSPASALPLPGEPGWSGEMASAEPGPISTFTLEDCVRLALMRNQRLKASGYEVEAAKGKLREAKALFWPVLEYNYRVAPVPTNVDDAFNSFFEGQVTLFNSIHLGIGVPLATFGQLGAARHLATQGVEAARLNEIKAHEVTVYQVKQLYYGTQLAQEMVRLLSDAAGKIGSKIADEERGTDSDEMDPYDLMKLKLTKTDLERRLAESEQHLELAQEGLRIAMDLDPGVPVGVEGDHLEPVAVKLGEEQSYVDAAVRYQPDSRLMDVGVEAKRTEHRLEQRRLFPKLGFGFYMEAGRTMDPIYGLVLTDDFNNPFNYTRAGLGVQLKGELDFHGASGRIKKARAEYYKVSYERMIAKRALALDVRKAYLSARRAQQDVARARKMESLARQMTFISKINLDMGIGENEKYGDALMLWLVQRGQYFKSVFDYNMALADLGQKVTIAKYEEMTAQPTIEEAAAMFEGEGEDGEGGFETYGIESGEPKVEELSIKAPGHEPALEKYMESELGKDSKGAGDATSQE